MSIIFILTIAAAVVWRWLSRGKHDDGLGRVLGEATAYAECPSCSERDTQAPRGRGEVITRGGAYVVRQYHVCSNCGTKSLWHRRLDLWVWTIHRNGVA